METSDFFRLCIWNCSIPMLFAAILYFMQRLNFLWTRPGLRHLLWLSILVGAVVPPLLPLPVLPAAPEIAASSRVIEEDSLAAVSMDAMSSTEMPAASVTTPNLSSLDPIAQNQSPLADPPRLDTAQLGWIALFGSLAVSLSLFAASLSTVLQYRRIMCVLPTHHEADNVCEELANSFGATKRPRVCIADHLETPSLFAGIRPAAIVLPQSVYDTSTESQIQQMIGHELAHYVRLDHWSGLIASVVTFLFWWNPLMWIARRQMLEASENCCDAMVIDRLSYSRKSYAELLLKVIDATSRPRKSVPLTVAMSSNARSIPGRFKMIGNRSVRIGTTRLQRFAVVVLIATMAWVPMHSQAPLSPLGEISNGLPRDLSQQPWLGSWRTKWSEEGLLYEGRIVFGYDPTMNTGRGRVNFTNDHLWEEFRYQVNIDQDQNIRIRMDFEATRGGGPHQILGRFQMLSDGKARLLIDPSSGIIGIEELQLFAENKVPTSEAFGRIPGTFTGQVDDPIQEPLTPYATSDRPSDFAADVDTSSQRNKEIVGTKHRMKLFFQLHSEVKEGDTVWVMHMSELYVTERSTIRRALPKQRAKIVKVHSQEGPTADVSLAFAKPYPFAPGGASDVSDVPHAFVEHGVYFDESTRRAGDTSDLCGTWKLISIERADGYDSKPAGNVEMEVTNDTWKVLVDGEYRSTKLVSADPFQSPKHMTLIQPHRGTGAPVVHRGLYRINDDRLEVYFRFSLDERPAAYDLTTIGRIVPFEVKQLWQRVKSMH